MAFDLRLEEQRDRRGKDAASASPWPLYRRDPCLLHADNNGGEEEEKRGGGGRRPGAFQAILSDPFILSSIFAGPHVVHGSISATVMLYV